MEREEPREPWAQRPGLAARMEPKATVAKSEGGSPPARGRRRSAGIRESRPAERPGWTVGGSQGAAAGGWLSTFPAASSFLKDVERHPSVGRKLEGQEEARQDPKKKFCCFPSSSFLTLSLPSFLSFFSPLQNLSSPTKGLNLRPQPAENMQP